MVQIRLLQVNNYTRLLGIGLGILLVVLGILAFNSQDFNDTREAAEEARSSLPWIWSALREYRNKNGQFPPSVVSDDKGKPMYSWRVAILYVLDEKTLGDMFDKADSWNSKANSKLIAESPFHTYGLKDEKRVPGATAYLAVDVPGTYWGTSRSVYGEPNSIIAIQYSESDTIWSEPREFKIDKNEDFDQLAKKWKGCWALFRNGDVRQIPRNVSAEQLHILRGISPHKEGGE